MHIHSVALSDENTTAEFKVPINGKMIASAELNTSYKEKGEEKSHTEVESHQTG
jgi:hypothetical protein